MGDCTEPTTQMKIVQSQLHNGRLYRANYTLEDCTEPTTQWKIVQSQLHNGRLYRANYTMEDCTEPTGLTGNTHQ